MEWMLLSSLSKVFEEKRPDPWVHPSLTLLKNQRGAFQIAIYSEEQREISLHIAGIPAFEAYQVTEMPSSYPCHSTDDPLYLKKEPGLYPDLLKPVSLKNSLTLKKGVWQAFFLSMENLNPGDYLITANAPELPPLNLPLQVKREALPEQTLYHTEWFHGDCLADFYGTEVFSETHWKALEGFIKGAARCGVNMLLTPLFTPPLDTQQGGERTAIQLVDVSCRDGVYSFSFEKLRRWVSLCRQYGIKEFEMSHLFTQWGAIAAPKVLVRENGALISKFGWHTPAVGQYSDFLRIFLKELKKELLNIGIWEHSWFHISDEPSEDQRQDYEKARNAVIDLLPEDRCIDALSSFDFYRHGSVKRPVVAEDHLEPFLNAKVEGLFTYYCTAQGDRVPNRFFSMPSGRNRILGVLLYQYDLKGFLHWGLNFYNTQYSLKHIDPFHVTDAGGVFPSGDAFLLYPGPNLEAWPSLRSEVLYDGLQDLRLLRLAEEKIGRQRVLSIIQDTAGFQMDFFKYPTEYSFFERLQEAILTACGI